MVLIQFFLQSLQLAAVKALIIQVRVQAVVPAVVVQETSQVLQVLQIKVMQVAMVRLVMGQADTAAAVVVLVSLELLQQTVKQVTAETV
jgi:hypothetical protein